MGKRIHKTGIAGQRALKKSFSRMLLDNEMMQEGKREKAWESYLKNKTLAQKKRLLQMSDSLQRGMNRRRKKIGLEGVNLIEQKKTLAGGLDKISMGKTSLGKMSPGELRQLKTALQSYRSNVHDLLQSDLSMQRLAPKEFRPFLKREIQKNKTVLGNIDLLVSSIEAAEKGRKQ